MSYYDDLGYSKSISDVKKLLSNLKPEEEVRLLYDKKKRYWFVIDAENHIHEDIIDKAFEQGLYPEFKTKYDARQYFAENQTVDDEYLFSFKAQGFSHPSERDVLLQHVGSDGYTLGYVLENSDGSGTVLYARSEYDINDTPLKYVNGNTKVYERQYDDDGWNSKLVDVTEHYQGNQSQTGRGGTARGAYSNNIIYLFEHADASTVIHELGHYFLDDLQKYGKSEKSQQQLQAIYNYLGAKDGVITNEMHEYFADSFEVYLKEGKAPNSLLRGVFIKFKNWLRRIFSEVKRLELVATHFLFVEFTTRPFAVQRICRV